MIVFLAVPPQVRSRVLSADALAAIGQIGALVEPSDSFWTGGSWSEAATAEVVITGWGTPPIDEAALAAMPRLTTILHVAGTVRALLGCDPWTRGIVVATAAAANNAYVADFAAACIVLALKGVFTAGRVMHDEGRLPALDQRLGSRGRRVGLVSYGSVARSLRARLEGYGMELRAWDPHVGAEELQADGVGAASSLSELFAECDLISLHTPLIPGVTEGLIGRDLLALMPAGATLLNTARGGLVDESALADVLTARPDLFAVLDATTSEPPEPSSPLYGLPNVLLTGHVAGSVGRESEAMGDLIVSELRALAAGEPLRHTVDRKQALTRA